MPQVNKLKNYYAGKIYKSWDSITTLEGQGGFLATKQKNGKYIQLLITDKGNTKELLYDNGKIMDVVDIKGVKRTYTYNKDTGKDIIKGQMIIAKQEDKNPLITAAKWISKNCMPERLYLKLSPKHPGSEIFVPAKHLPGGSKPDFLGMGKLVKAQEVLAKDFRNPYEPLPNTILIKTSKGETYSITSENPEENSKIIKQLGIDSEIFGWKLRTMV